jgi:hypothetical protein
MRENSRVFSDVLRDLGRRRRLMFFILFVATSIVFLVNALFEIEISDSLEIQTQQFLVYVLIIYKVIELFVIYTVFYKRHLKKYLKSDKDGSLLAKFEKNGKRFFMLVAQGNIVFGVISFKLLANPYIFLLFMAFALTTLLAINPKKLARADII